MAEHTTWDLRHGAQFSSDGQWMTYERAGVLELYRRHPDRPPSLEGCFDDGGEVMDYIWSLAS